MKYLIIIVCIFVGTKPAFSQYVDPNFSIKGFKVFVQIIDLASDGCWTNLSETKSYIEDKISQNGAQILKARDKTDLTLNLLVQANRSKYGWCYGNTSLTLTANIRVGSYTILGTFYQKNEVNLEPQHFNAIVLPWLDRALREIK